MPLEPYKRIPLHDHSDRNAGGRIHPATGTPIPASPSHDGLTGVRSDQHHAKLHAASHAENATDELFVEDLGTSSTDTTKRFAPDGAGGVTLAAGGSTTFGTPALTLGTSNTAGATDEAIRRDATILAFDATVPAALGTAAAGSATVAARRDHVHTLPKLDDLATPDDNTDLDASTSAHGLLRKLGTDPTKYLDNTGNFTTPGTVVGASSLGFSPYAYPIGADPTANVSNTATLGANGGSRAAAIFVASAGYLDGVWILCRDTGTQRTWGWDLYYQASVGSATLTRVAASNGNSTFTPSAISSRYLAASSAPVFLLPGTYWLVVQNRHATNTFGLGVVVAGTMSLDIAVSALSLTGTNGATIDLTSAGWGRVPSIIGCALYFRVFNESAPF